MTNDPAFLLAQAESCAAEAAAATLSNVRERALRSEAAWRAMAARHDRLAEQRARTEAEKRHRLATEGAPQASPALDGSRASA